MPGAGIASRRPYTASTMIRPPCREGHYMLLTQHCNCTKQSVHQPVRCIAPITSARRYTIVVHRALVHSCAKVASQQDYTALHVCFAWAQVARTSAAALLSFRAATGCIRSASRAASAMRCFTSARLSRCCCSACGQPWGAANITLTASNGARRCAHISTYDQDQESLLQS